MTTKDSRRNKYGLSQSSVQKICAVLSRYPQVEKAILYGSRAKGNYKNGSDIDLTLRGGADLTLNVVYKILSDLDDLLLPYTIDLSIFNHIGDPDVIEHIQRAGVTFYQKGEAITELASR
jgi:predicted nucleotidyltransferase